MSQYGRITLGTGAAPIEYITVGGGTVTPDALGGIAITNGANITWTAGVATMQADLTGTTNHAVQVGNAANSLTSLGIGLTAQVLKGNTAADPSWGAVDLTTDVTGLLPVGSGGTGVGTHLINALIVGRTAAAVVSLAVGATNQVLLGNTGADPSWGTVGNAALTNSSVTLTDGANITVTGSPLSLGGAATIAVSGCTQYALQVGDATNSLDSLALGTAGQVLVSGGAGANPAWTTSTIPTTAAIGDVIYASAVNTLTMRPFVATATRYLKNTGDAATTPEWGLVDMTNGVTGTLPVGNGGTGLTSLAVAKTIYVTKSGNDGNTGTDINHAFLTIQAAVTAAVAGDTILVYPGTYTETVTHAANDVSVFAMGDSTNCIIEQADANVIDFNTRTGIVYKFFRIQVTAATTAINTIQGTTGSCAFTDCYLRMVCATDIVAATQPAVANVTGAGVITVSIGSMDYLHTGNCGGAALKSALLVGAGGLISVYRNSNANVTCSGTALATAFAIDLAGTGNINAYTSAINVTDPDAGIVAGLGYFGGVGTAHEYFRNNVHITIGAANIGYGFYAGDAASESRFYYNHIHVTDAGGTSYSFYVGATATVISQFDDIIAADGIDLVATGLFYAVDSQLNGNLMITGPSAGATRLFEIANTDNTATASSSGVHVSVGGATSTGDPYVNFLVTGAGTYSVGIDNTVAGDPLKITSGATPSAGTDLLTMTSAGVITLNNDLDVSEGGTGVSTLTSHGVLLGNGAGDIQATAEGATGTVLAGVTGGNPVWTTSTYPTTSAVGDVIYASAANTLSTLAFDNTATRYLANTGGGATVPAWDQINLTNGVSGILPVANGGTGVANPTDHCVLVGSGNAAVTPITAGATGELLCGVTGDDPDFANSSDGDFTFTSATAAVQRTLTVSNTDNTAVLSPANVQVTVGGDTNTGDPYVNFLVTGSDTYSVGIDNSVAGNPFKITSGASPSAGTDLLTMSSAGVITLNNDLDVSEGGTGVSTLTSHGVLLGNGAGDIQALAEATDGQIPIGSTGNNPILATITAGANINIGNAAGSITITAAAGAGGITWNVIAADLDPMVVNNGYICNKAGLLSVTLPVAAAVGSMFCVTGMNTAVGWRIVQLANQQIHFGTVSTTAGAGGYLEATNIRDSVWLVCVVADLEFNVINSVGNITIA